mgnify:CR=1 FL=1
MDTLSIALLVLAALIFVIASGGFVSTVQLYNMPVIPRLQECVGLHKDAAEAFGKFRRIAHFDLHTQQALLLERIIRKNEQYLNDI